MDALPNPQEPSWEIWSFHSWGPWLSVRLVHAAVFLVCAFLLDRAWRAVLQRARKAAAAEDPDGQNGLERRVQTHAALFGKLGAIFFYSTALLMIVRDFGVEIGPLLAGLGIVGVAVGFGAQYLVRDVISGFFIILENQIHIGDIVRLGEAQGVVEAIRLRTVQIRTYKGEVHIVPNGEIRLVTNLSRQWARAILDVGVSYAANLNDVFEALGEVGRRLQADPEKAPLLLEAPEILGVMSLGDSSVTVRLWAKIHPPERVWEMERHLRKAAKEVFDERGIEIPFPQRTLSLDRAAAEALRGARKEPA